MPYLQTVKPQVVHETVDGEVVIVHLDKGLYFSTVGVGACIWTLIQRGDDTDAIIEWATVTYPTIDTAAAEVGNFLAELVKQELVREAESPVASEDELLLEPPEQYESPELQVYTDMEDLLLLDPIHDVEEEQGWPNATA
jgi:hypothetical protein